MIRKIRHIIYLGIVLGVVFTGCDNESNVDPNYEKYFVKYYGNEGNQQGVDVEILPEGYLLLGTTTPTAGNSSLYIVQTDNLGNRVDAVVISTGNDLIAKDMVYDGSGNVYILAEEVRAGQSYFYLSSVNIGNIGGGVINEYIQPAGAFDWVPESLLFLEPENELIAIGSTTDVEVKNEASNSSDVYSLRFNTSLNAPFEQGLWKSTYGRSDAADYGKKIIRQGSDFLVLATSNYTSDPQNQLGLNLMVFALSGFGNVINANGNGWITFGTGQRDEANDIAQTSDGGSVLVGTTTLGTSETVFIQRLNSNNEPVLQDTENTLNKSNVNASSIIEASNGGYILCGNWMNSSINNSDFYLAKVNLNNEIEWDETFGGLDQDKVSVVRENPDGTILIVGTVVLDSQEKMCLIKANPSGKLKP